MSNLGGYQFLTTAAKKLGGPTKFFAVVLTTGYVLGRPIEAGVKAGGKRVIRVFTERSAPCATKGQVFRCTAEGHDRDLIIRVGDDYRVMECDGDAILIEVLGNPDSPYTVSSTFLRSVSDYPKDDTGGTT